MTRLGSPYGVTLAAAGAMVCMLSYQQPARAAPAFRVECPRMLPGDAVPVREHADGWAVTAPAGRVLDGWGILTGAPNEEAHLKPGSSTETRRGTRTIATSRWNLEVPHAYEHWMFCSYGAVILARRLPATATECTATLTTIDRQRMPPLITCK